MNKKRMRIIFSVFLILIFGCILRIGYFSIFLHRQYSYQSVSQRMNLFIYDSNRGDIVDRNLTEITGNNTETMLVYSPYLENEDDKAALIAEGFEQDEEIGHNHIIVEMKDRSPKVAEHLIGIIGYAPYYKIKGYQGLTGLEKQFDRQLAGKPAKVMMIFDGSHRPVIHELPVIVEGEKNSNKLVLTIDIELQQKIEAVIDEQNLIERGAVVVLDPFNGQVLSMISRPKINYNSEDDGSHLNKAIQIHKGANPASIFKMVIGLYGLESGIDSKKIYQCQDMCIYDHGLINFQEGFSKSCNQVFYEMVTEFGPEKIIDYSKKLGLGAKTDIDLNNEGPGRLPQIDTVRGVNGNRLLAMGQGGLEVTPLQIAKVTGVIANGGYDFTPKVVDYVGQHPVKVGRNIELGEKIVAKNAIDEMQEMMNEAAISGTASYLKGFGAVKTGTADNRSRWLTGFFPHERPQYVITIFIEEGYGKSTREVTERIVEAIFQ